jgi:hypothetical protein
MVTLVLMTLVLPKRDLFTLLSLVMIILNVPLILAIMLLDVSIHRLFVMITTNVLKTLVSLTEVVNILTSHLNVMIMISVQQTVVNQQLDANTTPLVVMSMHVILTHVILKSVVQEK